MSLIQWGVDFYTGLPEVDDQHCRLVALANRLSETSLVSPSSLNQVFQELRDYIVEHFSLEERLMDEAQIDSEFLNYHKNAHSLFVAKVENLWGDFNQGADTTPDETLAFLKTWIIQHILHTDRLMAQKIHEKLGTEAPHNMFTHF